ncbi:hypothetical protein GE09DRAFT_250046 [Coniochaeta sp. 2T2.1]|nr:hypothetical protein GE09DRAFT_250046 [Coniochaeta sp. 2T2.1]
MGAHLWTSMFLIGPTYYVKRETPSHFFRPIKRMLDTDSSRWESNDISDFYRANPRRIHTISANLSSLSHIHSPRLVGAEFPSSTGSMQWHRITAAIQPTHSMQNKHLSKGQRQRTQPPAAAGGTTRKSRRKAARAWQWPGKLPRCHCPG